MKPRILVFCDFYLPGFKSGGGMWTVVNLVDRFCDQFDFFIVTRNYDGRSDTTPYTSVLTGKWNIVGNAHVYYASDELITQANFAALVREVDPSLVYLNSVFCTPGIKFLALRRRNKVRDLPVILAPCGELSDAALGIKSTKKRAFLSIAKLLGLHFGVTWKGSTELEAEEIRKAVGPDVTVMIAPDLPPREILPQFVNDEKPSKQKGSATFCFVSRVDRKKNLHFLLRALAPITKGNVVLKIVGPQEDPVYWAECERLIEQLPTNIRVEVAGGVPYDSVLSHLMSSHFFVLPTLNENFGYVFVEAMAAGCPIMISDRTIWNDVESAGAGTSIGLEYVEPWTERIRDWINMDQQAYSLMSAAARKFAVDWLGSSSSQASVAAVLSTALNRKKDI